MSNENSVFTLVRIDKQHFIFKSELLRRLGRFFLRWSLWRRLYFFSMRFLLRPVLIRLRILMLLLLRLRLCTRNPNSQNRPIVQITMVEPLRVPNRPHLLQHILKLRVHIIWALHFLHNQIHKNIMHHKTNLLVQPNHSSRVTNSSDDSVAHAIFTVFYNLPKFLADDSFQLFLKIIVVQIMAL